MANQSLNGVLSFRDATRQQAKASILIEGLSGRGKSGLALLLGHALAGKDWSKVYAVDIERRISTVGLKNTRPLRHHTARPRFLCR